MGLFPKDILWEHIIYIKYLEALPKKIKYKYLEGKQCKHLDQAINALMALVLIDET